jgi:hypothetical protein
VTGKSFKEIIETKTFSLSVREVYSTSSLFGLYTFNYWRFYLF